MEHKAAVAHVGELPYLFYTNDVMIQGDPTLSKNSSNVGL